MPTVIGVTSPLSALDLLQSYGSVPTSAAWPSANLALLVPFELPFPYPVKKAAIHNGATISGNFDVGIYDAAGNRLVSSGSTAQSGVTTIQVVTLTTTVLLAGNYWMALAFDNTTATLGRWTPGVPFLRMGACRQAASAFPLPTTPTLDNPANDYLPRFEIGSQLL